MHLLHPEPPELPLRLMILVKMGMVLGYREEEGLEGTGWEDSPLPLAACPRYAVSAQ